ncbi:putative hemolysin [Comamonas humi]
MKAWMFATAAAVLLAACTSGGSGLKPLEDESAKETESYATQYPGPRNPASAYCAQMGGTVILSGGTRSQASTCRFPDGKTMDAWDLFWRDNGKN